MTLPQKPIKWAKTLGYEVGTEAVRRWNCHDDLLLALRGLIGFCELLASREDDLPANVREQLATNHRIVDARDTIAKAEAPAPTNTDLLAALKRLLAAPELHSDYGNPGDMIAERTAAREQAAEAVRKAESAV
jgi:hypothetical protein